MPFIHRSYSHPHSVTGCASPRSTEPACRRTHGELSSYEKLGRCIFAELRAIKRAIDARKMGAKPADAKPTFDIVAIDFFTVPTTSFRVLYMLRGRTRIANGWSARYAWREHAAKAV